MREAAEQEDRRRAEEAMRQSEHKYRELFESLGDAAFLADEETGKIIDTNRCAQAMLGCTRSQILGHKQGQFLVLQEPSQPGGHETPAVSEGRMVCPDGGSIPVEVRATPLTLYDRPLVLRLCHKRGE